MATSGSYSFTVTRDDLIKAALRGLQVYDSAETVPPQDITDCAFALNVVVKELVTQGLPLWCVQDVAIPMVAGQASYNVGAATNGINPLRVFDAYLRNDQGQDTVILKVSRSDYDSLGYKASQGTPNQLFYDPQIGNAGPPGNGIVTVYNTPFDSTTTLHIIIQRTIQDFLNGTDTPDFPQAAYRLLKWCLMEEICQDYEVKPHIMQRIDAKVPKLKEDFFAFAATQDDAPMYFTPSMRRY